MSKFLGAYMHVFPADGSIALLKTRAVAVEFGSAIEERDR